MALGAPKSWPGNRQAKPHVITKTLHLPELTHKPDGNPHEKLVEALGRMQRKLPVKVLEGTPHCARDQNVVKSRKRCCRLTTSSWQAARFGWMRQGSLKTLPDLQVR